MSIPVGLDPVSVRARSSTEAWVVNHISDSISVVDITAQRVIATIATSEEPQDVVFVAGSPARAFVSCSHDNRIQIYNATTRAFIQNLTLAGEEPRALAVSPDGSKVYAAIFESGNGSTLLGGGIDPDGATVAFPPNAVNDPNSPYLGKNPPSNTSGGFNDVFNPPLNPAIPIGPPVGLIVKRDAAGAWRDDNGTDWSSWVNGANAAQSGRVAGWTLIDNDLAVIDTATLNISYATRMMNICMSVAVNPGNGRPYVIGTDGTNEIRFEPVVSGRFLRVEIAAADPSGPTTLGVVDMNPHLDYSTSTIAQSERDKSLGDPRGMVWNSAGTRGYVTGMGSNNMIVIDATGARVDGTAANPVNLGQGPTGLALDESRGQLYVFNRFEGTLSVVRTSTLTERVRVALRYDPTPGAIVTGRKHLYDTHKNSGLGQIACGSCHIDGRMDRLAWDLGDPSGSLKSINEITQPSDGQTPNFYNNLDGLGTVTGQNLDSSFHPMKGPMTTQTLQDIIGKEPLHWRGDRDGIEQFNGAFIGLQGDDTNLTTSPAGGEMQEFENFLATIYFPPNPFRQITNQLPTSLNVSNYGQYATGRHTRAEGTNLPNGNAQNGLTKYRLNKFDAAIFDCVACHTLPTGAGANRIGTISGVLPTLNITFAPIDPGPDGGLHLTMTSRDGSTQDAIKVPELRNLYDKIGLDMKPHTTSITGFGFIHDGSVDTLSRFVDEPVFTLTSDQDVADVVALLLSFAGGDMPLGRETGTATVNLSTGAVVVNVEPVGEPSRDTHAGVGKQVVVTSSPVPATVNTMFSEARETGTETPIPLRGVDLIVKGRKDMGGGNFVDRGWVYDRIALNFKEDRNGDTITVAGLAGIASVSNPLTYMMVPRGSGTRLGVDQDEDGYYDRTEIEACT
ncbi:hypothetical protein HY256_00565, partial [Candidatus Sumerlaeota bacterium]|nr:hypothetical protein [Candidatus Sumerlaeota bacterium]